MIRTCLKLGFYFFYKYSIKLEILILEQLSPIKKNLITKYYCSVSCDKCFLQDLDPCIEDKFVPFEPSGPHQSLLKSSTKSRKTNSKKKSNEAAICSSSFFAKLATT